MPTDILLIITITAVIQSIFGVGVLLFGTPLMLLAGYDFINTLRILLPISIAINSLQILKHYHLVDRLFFRHVLLFAIPFVVLFLFIVSTSKININILVGIFLIFVALKNFSLRLEKLLESLVKFEKIYLAIMGIIHGLTNLGGSLLTAIVHAKQYDKDQTRVTIAICYATFAVFQLLTLAVLGKNYQFSFSESSFFMQIGILVFLLTEEIVYTQINNKRYSKIFAGFLFASGILLLYK
jgi:uncharacterized membrane protein YfcA